MGITWCCRNHFCNYPCKTAIGILAGSNPTRIPGRGNPACNLAKILATENLLDSQRQKSWPDSWRDSWQESLRDFGHQKFLLSARFLPVPGKIRVRILVTAIRLFTKKFPVEFEHGQMFLTFAMSFGWFDRELLLMIIYHNKSGTRFFFNYWRKILSNSHPLTPGSGL